MKKAIIVILMIHQSAQPAAAYIEIITNGAAEEGLQKEGFDHAKMLIQDDLAKLIQFYPVLGELPASLQYAFEQGCYPVHAQAGEILFDADSPGTSFLLLTEGSIRLLYPGIDRELLLYRLQPGECCILTVSHLLSETWYPVQAQVESAISAVAIPQPLFRQMVEQSPLFSAFLFHSFASRLTGLLDLLGAVATMRLDQRLAGLLLSKGTIIKTTHSQLADELGSVREVISRILKDFEDRELIELARGQIYILDKESLENLHHFGDSSH